MVNRFHQIVLDCAKDGITDIHLTGGHQLVYRHNGKIDYKQDVLLSPEEMDQLTMLLLTPAQLDKLREQYSVDVALSIKHVRLRINIFTTWRGLSFAIRILPGTIPSLSMLNLLPIFDDIITMREGLVLFCGPTGSGKTTTIAGIIHEMSTKRTAHIVTLEDPIEYRFPSGKSFIQQREFGTHFPSFEQGLVDVLREDPDIILVGELRDPETMRLALDAAESGHLVIATMHSASPEETILRFINSFPAGSQEFARNQLAAVLKGIYVQKLCYEPSLQFRIPLFSILRTNAAVRTIIRENKTSQLASVQQLHTTHDMHTIESYKDRLFTERQLFHKPEESLRPSFELVQEEAVLSSLLQHQQTPIGEVPQRTVQQESKQTGSATSPLDDEFERYIEALSSHDIPQNF